MDHNTQRIFHSTLNFAALKEHKIDATVGKVTGISGRSLAFR
jgi:hypothetical protein